jgi:hypothetical protein
MTQWPTASVTFNNPFVYPSDWLLVDKLDRSVRGRLCKSISLSSSLHPDGNPMLQKCAIITKSRKFMVALCFDAPDIP